MGQYKLARTTMRQALLILEVGAQTSVFLFFFPRLTFFKLTFLHSEHLDGSMHTR